ncbi:MAG TPA: transketolase [Anaerolineaceae bacterium]|nr:transketolase [Anaerolineaceae bacterium]
MSGSDDFQKRAIDTIRFLSADAVQQANSGHPGLPMGAAAMAFTVWTRHLRFNPRNPEWPNRDRFVLSGGHGSMLLYSMLYLSGYNLSLDDIKHFRQWGSITPGHPESFLTPGVETTTGPLGQGFGNGVGMAIAEKHLAALFNQADSSVVDYRIYAIVTDGDLMEGVASEAASLAGHLKLGNLIYLYDDNNISIEGSTDLAFTEDRGKRFEAYGWHVQTVENATNDVEAIDAAIRAAKEDPRPSLIICKTEIGYGMPHRQGTAKAHGEPPGDEELNAAKQNLGWPLEPRFYVPEDVLDFFRQAVDRGAAYERTWQDQVDAYTRQYPDLGKQLESRLTGVLPADWAKDLMRFPTDAKGLATRVASGKALNQLAERLPELIGGSADLAPSTNTLIKDGGSFEGDTPEGRNLHFGVREHGMGAIVNGMASTPGIIPYGATFLVFSDYMRPSVRLSALSHLPSIWVWTHDSIGLGEDGPTHQPVEHLAALRAIPELVVIRPADANETVVAWETAIRRRSGPTALILTRQAVPTLDRSVLSPAEGLAYGAYVLADIGDGDPDIILMATGSEVQLIVDAGSRLAAEGRNVRIVSFPSWELFAAQPREYRESVFPSHIHRRLAVEAGVSQGWDRWVGDQGEIIALDRFGHSAPGKIAMEKLGFTVDHVIEKALELLHKESAPISD